MEPMASNPHLSEENEMPKMKAAMAAVLVMERKA